MSNWPFIAGAYGVTLLGVLVLGLEAILRQGRARRRLVALETASRRRRGKNAPLPDAAP